MKVEKAGFSHGDMLVGLIDEFPAGVKVDLNFINSELKRRLEGGGRGVRVKKERDEVTFVSGVMDGVTTGFTVAFVIKNRVKDRGKVSGSFNVPRPGHADFAGMVKFGLKSFVSVQEAKSARITAVDVAAGSLFKLFLKQLKIEVGSFVLRIGRAGREVKNFSAGELLSLRDKAEKSSFNCPFPEVEKLMAKEVSFAEKSGTTVGGEVLVFATGVPPGIGSFSVPEKRLDSKVASLFFAVPSVKGVINGFSETVFSGFGKDVIDEIEVANGKIKRKTNFSGGIEGGMSNGEPVVFKVFVKPVPTQKKRLNSFDFNTLRPAKTPVIRGDSSSVVPVSVILESKISEALTDLILDKFGHDTMEEIKRAFEKYVKTIQFISF